MFPLRPEVGFNAATPHPSGHLFNAVHSPGLMSTPLSRDDIKQKKGRGKVAASQKVSQRCLSLSSGRSICVNELGSTSDLGFITAAEGGRANPNCHLSPWAVRERAASLNQLFCDVYQTHFRYGKWVPVVESQHFMGNKY